MIPLGSREDRSLRSYRNQLASIQAKRERRIIASVKKRHSHVVFNADAVAESIKARDRRLAAENTEGSSGKEICTGTSGDVQDESASSWTHDMTSMRQKLKDMNIREEIVIVTTVDECKAMCKKLKRHKYITVDCEGVSLSRTGALCLLHVGAPNLIVMFDISVGGDALFGDGGLRAFLEDERIVKIMHDCRSDADALGHQFNTQICNIFDTQLAFAITRLEAGKEVPFPVGLNTLIKMFSKKNGENVYKTAMHEQMEGSDAYWSMRPLSATMIGYCAIDISMMKTIYKNLINKISDEGIPKIMELSSIYVDQKRGLEIAFDRNKHGNKACYGFPEWDAVLDKRRADKEAAKAAAEARALQKEAAEAKATLQKEAAKGAAAAE